MLTVYESRIQSVPNKYPTSPVTPNIDINNGFTYLSNSQQTFFSSQSSKNNQQKNK